MIICAAVKLIKTELYGTKLAVPHELVICGHRHGNCLATIQELGPKWTNSQKIQGFIDHNNTFLDRKESYQHALACGQLSATHKYYQEDHNIHELYSEDLY